MQHFTKIYQNDGNVTIKLDKIEYITEDQTTDNVSLTVGFESGTTKTFHWYNDDFGKVEARELRNMAYKELTGMDIDD